MNKKLFVLVILLFSLLSSTKPVMAEQVEARQLDKTAKILAAYLATHGSPLEYHAQDFIDAARQYDLNWRLVAAISGVESTFGKFIPGGYNAWGWGVYDPYHAIYFNSWKEGIYTVSKGLREDYINKGLTEPLAMNRAYATSSYWGGKVIYFMDDIEKFAQKYEAENRPVADVNISPDKISATSGQLAFR